MELSPSLRKWLTAAAIAAAAVLLASLLWVSGVLNLFEQKTWDLREQAVAKPGPDSSEIALIKLDQASLDWGKEVNQLSWPWPRQIYSYIIEFCKRAGVRSLAFDVVFTEPSKYGVFDDQAFGESIAGMPSFVAALPLERAANAQNTWPAGIRASTLTIEGLAQWLKEKGSTATGMPTPSSPRSAVLFPHASFSIPEVSDSALHLGNVTLAPESDGIYRRGTLFSLYDGRVVPSLALASYLAGQPGKHAISISKGFVTVDRTRVPIGADGSAYLRYRGPSNTYKAYSAAAIIQSEVQIESNEKPNVDPTDLKGKYVIFGFTALGLLDLRQSPMKGEYTGMEVHATMLDNLLSGDFIRTVAPLWVILIALVLAFAASGVNFAFSGPASNVLTYLIALPIAPVLGLLVYLWGGRIPVIMLELAIVFALIGSGIAKYVTEGRQKRYIKGAFKQYLSPAVIEQLIANPDRLKLGGERRELSIYFSDLQGFTSLSENLSPEELTTLLNEYLSAMTDIIQDEGGTIDKYEGDAIIAFWNAPVEQADHAVRAVRASLRCQAKLAEMRPAFRERVGKELYMRIGLNTGPAVVGNMGSKTRFDYTMLGDAVNLASRLEGVNKQFRTFTMISQMTLDALDSAFPVRELSRIAVVGRKEPVRVFEPMTPDEYALRQDTYRVFAKGLEAFYAGSFADAIALFSTIEDQDPAAAAYKSKCEKLAASAPGDWDGVWIMTEK
ncbi:MAG TPA: adenylate/guanylate cyclase domain-containing protein [Spirochaetia bacterium]|nr:adenylate/guanylate cyclase domain-containing protein [Spirochaetia bacterium]